MPRTDNTQLTCAPLTPTIAFVKPHDTGMTATEIAERASFAWSCSGEACGRA